MSKTGRFVGINSFDVEGVPEELIMWDSVSGKKVFPDDIELTRPMEYYGYVSRFYTIIYVIQLCSSVNFHQMKNFLRLFSKRQSYYII